MSASPFAFLRGAATIMARDLAGTPASGIRVQLAGDAHLGNFGVFGTPERDLVFDVNDFDETLPGPWEWDVKRLATSLFVAGQQNRISRTDLRSVVRSTVHGYRNWMQRFASMPYLSVWYWHLDRAESLSQLSPIGRAMVRRAVARARGQTDLHAFPKMARPGPGGKVRIRDEPPLIVHYRDPADDYASRTFFDRYRSTLPEERRLLLDRYEVVDVAQKVVGVGSVGTTCSVLLLLGDGDVGDPLFLQLKEADDSALEAYLPRSIYPNHAQRVVVGQHLIQEASDVLLGWSRWRSRDFYIRQLRDMKFAVDIGEMGARELAGHAELCATALARAHARTGDPAIIAGYLGEKDLFDVAITKFAEAYAEQNSADYRLLVEAIRDGRLPCRQGG
jgi:uncharacterized protein (DUF2252 family)